VSSQLNPSMLPGILRRCGGAWVMCNVAQVWVKQMPSVRTESSYFAELPGAMVWLWELLEISARIPGAALIVAWRFGGCFVSWWGLGVAETGLRGPNGWGGPAIGGPPRSGFLRRMLS